MEGGNFSRAGLSFEKLHPNVIFQKRGVYRLEKIKDNRGIFVRKLTMLPIVI